MKCDELYKSVVGQATMCFLGDIHSQIFQNSFCRVQKVGVFIASYLILFVKFASVKVYRKCSVSYISFYFFKDDRKAL